MEFYKLGQGRQAYKSLDSGNAISFAPSSLRYSYDSEDSDTYNKWQPNTAKEKETLAPEGYFRVGDRAKEKDSRFKGIFESALANARKDFEEKKEGVYKSELDKLTNEQNRRFFGLGKIFTTAKKKAMIERKAREKADELTDDTESKARDRAEKEFNDQYAETQASIPSTAIANIRYNPKTEGLNVKFQGGKTSYFYPAVPLELVQRWLKAPSKGEFFMKNIHDQYSIFGKNHGKKSEAQHKGVRKYEKSYKAKNRNHKIGG